MSGEKRHRPDIFILRHGETVWNFLGRFQGRSDSPLTGLGRKQALRQRAILQARGDLPDAIFSSPLGRAVETSRIVFEAGAGIRLDDRLQEIAFGSWEGLTRDQIKSQIDCPFESGLWNFRSPGGEDFDAISGRARQFLDDLRGPAVVVTHGTTSLVLRGLCMGLDLQGMLTLPKDQGCVYLISNGQHITLR